MTYDAIVVGAGPNGLAAAITLARAGCRVLVLEAKPTIGGGSRTAELTLPGYLHDVCSAIHPLALSSPFFQTLPLDTFGLEWVQPPAAVAHPLDDGTAMVVERNSFESIADSLQHDAARYRGWIEPLSRNWQHLTHDLLGPLPLPPRNPILMTRFGMGAAFPARAFAKMAFRGARARALFAGMAAHCMLSLDAPLTAAFGFVLAASAHAVGWPMAKGGSQRIVDGMGQYLETLGGNIITGQAVANIDELPPARAVLFDLTPKQILNIAGHKFPANYRRQLQSYRYGSGVFKMDWALSDPIPWKSAQCARAATVHLGGTLDEIADAENDIIRGQHPERPYVLLAQHTLFDHTRAPAGKHTAWAYCHAPHNSQRDMTAQIENQIERFAPGFKDTILGRSAKSAAQMESYNANYIGGDINGGIQDWRQLYSRPTLRLNPYTTPAKNIFTCSSSTPPGGGVHGMCGYYSAKAVLNTL